MSRSEVIRAWKDETYRESLSAELQASVPEHPAEQIELSESQLEAVAGGTKSCLFPGGCDIFTVLTRL